MTHVNIFHVIERGIRKRLIVFFAIVRYIIWKIAAGIVILQKMA